MRNRVKYISAKRVVAVVAALCVAVSSFAQLHVPAELRSCLEEGLVNNYELQIIRGEEAQAKNNASLANSGKLPTLSLDGGYDVDLDKLYPTAREAGGDNSTYHENDQTVDLGVSVDWTIFDGFKLRTSHERLRELERQGSVETRIAVEDYIASLTAEYYNYISESSRLRNYNMAVELSRERLRIVRARYVVGNFSRLDFQQARVDFNVDSASYIKQCEVVKSSAIAFNELLAKDDVNAELPITDTLITLDKSLNYAELYARTQVNNTELLHAQQSTSIAELDYKIVLARNYPYLDMDLGYGYYNYRYNNGTNTKLGRLGVQANLNLSFTIFDSTRKVAKKNAAITVKNAELNQRDVELKLKAQFNDLWQAYINNLGLLHLENNSLGAAKDNYEIAMERYMLGNLSGIEMREAQKSLLDAEDRILQATYNAKICEISLLQISGQISEYLE